jgi:hypothetical protein
MAISLPRRSFKPASSNSKMFCPWKWISPETILPGGSGISLMAERTLTLFPQPLSPTIPNVFPAVAE